MSKDRKVIVATLLCDHKLYSAERVLWNNVSLARPEGVQATVYANVETNPGNIAAMRAYEFLDDMPVHYDIWTWISTWRGRRLYDQDQRYRLSPICIARNMAREFALLSHADAILYIDSDVLAPPQALVELWREDKPIVGGSVPGRGCHGHVHYLGSEGQVCPVEDRDNLIHTDYATAGFVMIRRPVLQVVSWRWGGTAEEPGRSHSEDPLFAYDARRAGFGRWYVRTDLEAEHLDNPQYPLSEGATADF